MEPAARVDISFLPTVASKVPVDGAVILRAPEREPRRLEVHSSMDLSISLPAGSKWEVSAEIPGFWVRRKDLAVGPQGETTRLVLDLWPMGTISGTVKVKEKGAPLPKQILVKTLAAPSLLKRPSAPSGALDCPVDRKGAWSCSLPAATFDLVIAAEGSVPHYLRGVQVPAGKTVTLGSFELKRGSSVAGWVAVENGRIDPRQCVARLTVLNAGGVSLGSASELARTALQREIREDGFFQFTGLPPGTYTLEARQPGYPAVRLSPVRVDAGAETFLRDPLVLRHAVDLRFEIHPAQDWLDRPWRARVFKLGEGSPVPMVFEGRADEEGRFTVPGQSSGRFRVSLEDSLGNKLYSGEHSAEGPEPTPQSIEVKFVTVEGTVRLGEEALPAVLWFGGRSGATSAKMEADVEGRFQGVLPHEGLWRVQLESARPALSTWTKADVRASRSGKARVDITLPDTRVFGKVVDEQGKPVPQADLAVRGENLDVAQQTDTSGAFEVRGLPAGAVWLAAESSSRVSNRVFATLVEGRTVGPIELRLRQTRRVDGTVESAQGPVAGARVSILARTPDGGEAVAMTDTGGAFQVDLPRAASRVVAIASAPGFALRAFEASVDQGPLRLQVTDEAGALEITVPLTRDDLMRENLTLAAYQNGLPVPASALVQWASDQGQPRDDTDQTLRVPAVAPGEYRVCLVPRAMELLLPWSAAPEGAGCDSGVLAPGGTLMLKLGRPG